MTNPSGIHYKPKAQTNLRAKLLRHRKHLRGLLSQAQREPFFEAQQQLQAGMQHLAQSLPPQYREQLKEKTTLEAKQQATWLLTCFCAEVQKLDDTHHRLDEQRRTKQYRQTVATRPKVANRHVRSAGIDTRNERLTAVIDPVTGRPTTNAETVVHAVGQYYKPKLAAPGGPGLGCTCHRTSPEATLGRSREHRIGSKCILTPPSSQPGSGY
jgi:hypothetical protein